MSSSGNIFYDNVDSSLQTELNLRGKAGRLDRSNASINYMVTKIANVELTAYAVTSSNTSSIGILGGSTTRTGRYRPTSITNDVASGYLQDEKYNLNKLEYTTDTQGNITGATLIPQPYTDTTRRTGPYLKSVDINIGDHSMGLLNTATVTLVIPNPQRDLDTIEEIWFRPGRYVKIQIQHPDSAVISGADKRLANSVPNKERLKKLYPDWDPDRLTDEITKLNVFNFEGLVISFDFSYDAALQVEATLTMRGTSNAYTDISMYLPPVDAEQDKKNKELQNNSITKINETENTGLNSDVLTEDQLKNGATPNIDFYDQLYRLVDGNIRKEDSTGRATILTEFKDVVNNYDSAIHTDHFILAGQPYPGTINDADAEEYTNQIRLQGQQEINRLNISASAAQSAGNVALAQTLTTQSLAASSSLAQRLTNIKNEVENENNAYFRYITLGSLISYINKYILSKKVANSPQTIQIFCNDTCKSNYLPYLTSCDPNNILLLPKVYNLGDMNQYGDTIYYQKVTNPKWGGVYETSQTMGYMYPSRIFIRMELIQSICNTLSAGDKKNFTVSNFLTVISGKINAATGGSINLNLVTNPTTYELSFQDTKWLHTTDSEKLKNGNQVPVVAYSVPMGANHPNGTIVREFTFSAQLPENAKNLAYVLNQGKEISEFDIAPYINFMYNTKDPESIKKIVGDFKTKNAESIEKLKQTKAKLGLAPYEPELIQGLWTALNNYVKYPTGNIKESQIMVAPIFPFTAEFTIDGVNGFKYGDVVTFNLLPSRYQTNTVFSIIGIQHKVGETGDWQTVIKCIMRPKLD